jgi:hypothetical protein
MGLRGSDDGVEQLPGDQESPELSELLTKHVGVVGQVLLPTDFLEQVSEDDVRSYGHVAGQIPEVAQRADEVALRDVGPSGVVEQLRRPVGGEAPPTARAGPAAVLEELEEVEVRIAAAAAGFDRCYRHRWCLSGSLMLGCLGLARCPSRVVVGGVRGLAGELSPKHPAELLEPLDDLDGEVVGDRVGSLQVGVMSMSSAVASWSWTRPAGKLLATAATVRGRASTEKPSAIARSATRSAHVRASAAISSVSA